MKRALRGTGLALLVLVRVAVGLVDAGVIVTLFAGGNIGAAIGFLLIGVPVTFFIARWVALVVAAPFMIAGEPRPVRATSNPRTNARQADRDHIYAILASDDDRSPNRRTKTPPQPDRAYVDAIVVAHRRTKTPGQADRDHINAILARADAESGL